MERVGGKTPLKWYIREWRLHRGLTQEQLADRLDTNKGQISKLERGDQRMNDDWIAAIADALGIEPGELLFDPSRPSLNDLLRNATSEQVTQLREMAKILLGKSAA